MSYTQFGYTYPSSSQILVSGQHPISVSPCCPGSGTGPAESSGGLSPFPRLAPAGFGIYGYADHPLSSLAGTPSSAFYPSLPSPYDLKESRTSWSALQPSSGPACYPYDPSGLASCGPYADRYSTIDSVARRKNATRETTNTLKAWLYEHRKNPYPTKGEKIMLAIITKMTLTQVSTWFANARRRLKKENKMTWEPRNKTSEGEDRDSSSPRDKSDDNNTEDDSNMTSAGGVPGIDFLKQESDGYVNKHSFSDFDDPSLDTKASLQAPGTTKSCSAYTMNCYRTQQSSEDSGTSGSPSPARPLQAPCFGDRFDKGDQPPQQPQGKEGVFCDAAQPFGPGPRPKIWSLARTATSNSPPLVRRYPCQADYCQKEPDGGGGDCAKMKYGCAYPDFADDRTGGAAVAQARKTPAEELCCDRSVYAAVLPSCSVPAKCESADCLGPSERNSCMVKSQCSYEYASNGSDHYPYSEKQFKNKDLCAIEYPAAKCRTMDGSLDSKKLVPAAMPYPGPDPAGRTEYYGGGFEQAPNMGSMPKGTPNHGGIDIPDPSSLLRRSDQ